MTVKRIRCTCGRVYDPAKYPKCPDCGAETVVARAPEPHPPVVSPQKESEEKTVTRPLPTPSPFPLNPRVIGMAAAGLIGLVCILLLVRQCNKPHGVVSGGGGEPKPSPTASPTATRGQTTVIVIPPRPTPPPTPPSYETPPLQPNDLSATIANAASGATVKVPAGYYPGGLVVNKPLHLVADRGQVFIQGEGKECLSVRAKGVSVENFQFMCNGIGELAAVSITDGAELQMDGCKVQSGTAVGVAVAGNASLKTTGSGFTAANGIAVRLQQAAKGNFTQSSFSNSNVGLSLTNEAVAELHSCAFENDASGDSNGAIITISGSKTQLTGDDCHFSNNQGSIDVSNNATLILNNSPFKENGGARGIVALIAVRNSAHATLGNDTFESNRSGVLVTEGGRLEMEKCRFDSNGFRQREVAAGSLPITVAGQGSSATMRHTIVIRSTPYGVSVIDGGQLTIEDSEVSGTSGVGLIVGDRSAPGGHAEIKRSHFIGNATGIGVCAGGSANVEESECTGNNDGIVVIDANSQLKVTKTKLRTSRDHGLYAYNNSQATATDCDFRENARGAQSGYRGRAAQRAAVTLEDCRFGGNKVFAAGACAQSELTLTQCVFDGTDKTNIYKERSAIVRNDIAPEASPSANPSPTASAEESPEAQPTETPTPESSATPSKSPRPRKRPTPDPAHRLFDTLRRLVPPPHP